MVPAAPRPRPNSGKGLSPALFPPRGCSTGRIPQGTDWAQAHGKADLPFMCTRLGLTRDLSYLTTRQTSPSSQGPPKTGVWGTQQDEPVSHKGPPTLCWAQCGALHPIEWEEFQMDGAPSNMPRGPRLLLWAAMRAGDGRALLDSPSPALAQLSPSGNSTTGLQEELAPAEHGADTLPPRRPAPAPQEQAQQDAMLGSLEAFREEHSPGTRPAGKEVSRVYHSVCCSPDSRPRRLSTNGLCVGADRRRTSWRQEPEEERQAAGRGTRWLVSSRALALSGRWEGPTHQWGQEEGSLWETEPRITHLAIPS